MEERTLAVITLRFVTDNKLISKLIRAGEYGIPFPTHVEALMPDGTLLGAHLEGGVLARPYNYDAATWTMQQFVVVPCDTAQESAFVAHMQSQLGKPYDMDVIEAIAAGAILGQRDWREPDAWICSELASWALEGAGVVKKLPVGVNHITPRDTYVFCGAIVDIGQPEQRS
jgi:hypothetical protein